VKKLPALMIFGVVFLLALTGCTPTKPTQTFNTAKPNAACLIKAPTVKATSIKAGTTLKFSGKSAGCAIKYTNKGALTVNLTNVKEKTLVASATVNGSKQGVYEGQVYIPQVAPAGKYSLGITQGVEYRCAGGAECPAPITEITVKR
jgi:hypothetical protein